MKLLVVSGSMGSGKTTVMAEASDVLKSRGIAHAAIDLDALGVAHLPAGVARDIEYRNLESLAANFAAAGVPRLLLAAAVEDRAMLDRIRAAVRAGQASVCRLRAPLATMQRRVGVREPGMLQRELLERVTELELRLDRCACENFALDNGDGVSVTDLAADMLARAGWF